MNNRASALILGLFVILVLSILSSAFLYKQVNESFLTSRYADSAQALWIAEAGIQEARNNRLDEVSFNEPFGNGSYSVSISNIGSNYYRLISIGTIGAVSRTVEAVVSTRNVDPTKFKYGVESTVAIDFRGSSSVKGEDSPDPMPSEWHDRDPDYYKENSTFSFTDLFCFTSTEIKALADSGAPNCELYIDTWPSAAISGLNWVVAPSSHFNGNITGTGILIVEGDLRITGTINFDGIIYVMGELDMAGTALVSGAVLAESAASVDTTLTGTCDIEHSTAKITDALNFIKNISPHIVSWKEIIQ